MILIYSYVLLNHTSQKRPHLMEVLVWWRMRIWVLSPSGWVNGSSKGVCWFLLCQLSAAIHLPRGTLLFSTQLRCASCLLWGNESRVTFPLLIVFMWITLYSKTQATCVKDHYVKRREIKLVGLHVAKRILRMCLKWGKVQKKAMIGDGKHLMWKLFLISEIDYLLWTQIDGFTLQSCA